MNFIKRAFLSLKNRKWETILKVVLCTIIGNLVFSGLAIQTATEKTTDYVRQILGVKVTLSMNNEAILDQIHQANAGISDSAEGVYRFRPTLEPVPLDQARQLGNKPKILAYNFLNSTIATAKSFEPIGVGVNWQALEPDTELEPSVINSGNINLQGIFCSIHGTDFYDGTSSLIEGRHILQQDEGANVAVINEILAVKNNLQVGDSLSVEQEGKTVELEIVGIYKTRVTSELMTMPAMSVLPYNKIYVPYTLVNELTGLEQNVSTTVEYLLKSPEDVEEFIKRAESESDIDFETFQLTVNDTQYNQMTSVINKVADTSKQFVFFGIIAAIFFLGGMIYLTIHLRKEETNFLLSLGESHRKIAAQYLIEGAVIGIATYLLTLLTGGRIVDGISQQLLAHAVETTDCMLINSASPSFLVGGTLRLSQLKLGKGRVITDLDVSITKENIITLSGIAINVIIFSIILPGLVFYYRQPKAIMEKTKH